MKWTPGHLSLRGKLIGMTLVVTLAALTIALVTVVLGDIARTRRALEDNAVVIARTVGDYSISALAFGDRTAARENLERLASSPDVLGARLYDPAGRPFAEFGDTGFAPAELAAQTTEVHEAGDHIAVYQPLSYQSVNYGTIALHVSTVSLREKTRDYLIGIVVLLLGVGGFAYALVNRLQRGISGPLLTLAATAERISAEGDYTIRVQHSSPDEIGKLYSGFNAMLEQIAQRERARDLAEEALHREKEHAQVTLQSIGDGVITTDAEGRIRFANAVAAAITGWSPGDMLDRPATEVLYLVNELTGERLADPVAACMRDGVPLTLASNTLLVDRSGGSRAIEDSAAPIRDRNGRVIGAVVVFHDVSEARALRRQLTYQATHDDLTGLLNRGEFERRLEAALHAAREVGETHGLLYFDVDQFKVVNDTYGHAAGDALLRQAAGLLGQHLRHNDTFARLGGDEFAVLLERCDMENTMRVAETLRGTIHGFRFAWNDKTFELSVSVGVVNITPASESVGQILSAADLACYAAKDMGRNRIHVYTPDDSELATRHSEMHWVGRIRLALDEHRLLLYTQPIVALANTNGDPLHYEVLVRMLDENGRLVPPGAFVPAAERYNLMPAIDQWVVNQLFNGNGGGAVASLLRGGATLCVNLSGMSLGNDALLQLLLERIEAAPALGRRLCFEITETAAIARLPAALRFMSQLRKLGCRFSLDDFGSGLASFGYLRNLPVDFLKIDGAFVKRVGESAVDLEIVRAINQLGHVMGKLTVAEHVETPEIRRHMEIIGVDYVQGFGVAPPERLVG